MTRPDPIKMPLSLPPVGPRLRRLLGVVFALFALLAVNSVYLAGVTLAEWRNAGIYQNYFYQLMFLLHLGLGLAATPVVLTFALGHLWRVWRRPNRRAVHAGLALLFGIGVLIASGLVLMRFDVFSLKDPQGRALAYWLHVIAPLVVVWLFVLHRLAGPPIRWRGGLPWAGLAALLAGAMVVWPGSPRGPAAAPGEPFFPALAGSADGGLIPPGQLMNDGYCRDCHGDTHRAWSESMHRFASFNNPAYRFSVRKTRQALLARDGHVRGARFCAGCHDPVPLFSGAFDDPGFDDRKDPTAQAGITCTVCHAITAIDSPRGNADYTLTVPQHYPFAFSDHASLRWVSRQLIKAKPAFHKQTFLKPLHRGPEFCGSCHKVHLPPELNAYQWLRGQNHYDSYHLSGVSGHGVGSFYYPPRAVDNCAACHMPLEPSRDFGAGHFDASGQLTIHDHHFPAANTAIPALVGLDPAVNDRQQAFLQDRLRLDIFALRSGATLDGDLLAPLRPGIPVLQPGRPYLLDVVIRTTRMGHHFTQGTADSNEVWLELTLRQGDRVVAQSGARDGIGQVDPWAHFVNAYVLDRQGRRIDRRNAEDIVVALYDHQIPPGAADVVHYALAVPPGGSELTVEARLWYRKFDTTYLRYIQGRDFVRNDLPITLLARDRVTFPVAGGAAPVAPLPTPSPIPTWERWNDYGIGLLRKGGKGELRQAEAAFAEVERLQAAAGALNLTRVYLREGRLDEAAMALRRAAAATPPAPPWSIAWFTGLVDKQNGHLDAAIAHFQSLVETGFAEARQRGFDFGQDYRLLNELGQTLLERAKQERGPGRQPRRQGLLDQARESFLKVLALDPENPAAHYNLALVHGLSGDPAQAQRHRELHARYKPDDNARDQVVARHRQANPAADHAAEAVVIYPLQRAERVLTQQSE